MKDILLIGIVLFVLVALFGDGGVTISPTLSPEMQAALNVNYAPDRSVQTNTTTIEQQTNIDTNIERQTVIVNTQPATVSSGGGVSIVDGRPGGACFLVPGDLIVDQGSNGECQVVNAGQRYFVAPGGTRSWLRSQSDEPTALVQQIPQGNPTRIQPQAPATSIDGRWAALVPLDEVSTAQLKGNFTRNGGNLPLGFRFWTDKEQRIWLSARSESWR